MRVTAKRVQRYPSLSLSPGASRDRTRWERSIVELSLERAGCSECRSFKFLLRWRRNQYLHKSMIRLLLGNIVEIVDQIECNITRRLLGLWRKSVGISVAIGPVHFFCPCFKQTCIFTNIDFSRTQERWVLPLLVRSHEGNSAKNLQLKSYSLRRWYD